MDASSIFEQTNNDTLTTFIMNATQDREMTMLMNAIQVFKFMIFD